MPKTEKAVHLEAFKLYMEMGGMSQEFVAELGRKCGKSGRTARRWEKEFEWKERAKKPIDAAVEKLEAEQQINAEELISGLLVLCKTRMDGLATQTDDIKAVLAESFKRTKAGKLRIKTTNIAEVTDLVRAQSRLVRDEQAYMRLVLTLVGKPEQIMEDRMVVQFVGLPEGLFDDTEKE